jgi:predicted PurR-regulated permease PerM
MTQPMTQSAGAGGTVVVADVAADVLAEPAEVAGHAPRISRLTVAVGILAVIVLVAALYLARAFFVPLLIGILASYALKPVVDWLKACHVPRPVAAALVLTVVAGSLSWLTWSLSDGAAAMTESFPEAAQKLRKKLSAARSGGPTALQNMQEAANELQGAASEAGAKPGARVMSARAPESTSWLRDYALAQTALLFTVAAQTPIVLLLTYFLLASGEHFRRKLVHFVGPSGVIGLGFMTWLQSRFARVNAAVLFIALLFFGWLWGVWGLLLGAPLVGIAKVICDRIESLKPVGELLGR